MKAPSALATPGDFKVILGVNESIQAVMRKFFLIGIMSSPSQRVVSCSVAELDAALQHHITGGAVIICTSTAQEARRLLQVNWQCSSPSSLSLSPSGVHTQAQNLKTSPVPRSSPCFPLFNFTASDGKLGKSLGTKLAQNF